MSEGVLRLSVFLGVWLLLLIAERALAFAHNPQPFARAGRHLSLAVLGTLLTRVLLPLGAVGTAAWAQSQSLGVFAGLAWPGWIETGLALIALDLAIYWQHRAMHALAPLWRLHRVHHCDLQLDASTALRFHPVEIVLSMVYKMAIVVALGAPPLAVLIFEIVLNATALFSHANLHLPIRIERALSWFLVTPAMHRVHHAPDVERTNSNYGFCLSVWDRCFASHRGFRYHPDADGFGVAGLHTDERVIALLKQPLQKNG